MAGPHPADSDLLDFAAAVLAPARGGEVKAHLAGCARCKGVIEALQESTSPSGERLEPMATESTRASDPLIGQMLGEYRVVERLGQGGMGVLYRGEQPDIGKPVAIKVLLNSIAADPVLVERMLDEARAVNAARHPNIVDIFSFGRLRDGRPYLVMELLQGSSLASVLHDAGKLTAAQTMVVLAQAFAALEAAHAAGVIHRDLKPDNIFVDPKPDGWNVTLLDFGLAKRQGATDRGLTSPGMVVGTPGYMAPEQVRGSGTVSAKTDVYAMGVVAWTLLAGREPFGAGSVVEVMHRHLSMPAPSLAAAVADVPPGLEQLVMQMLQKDPDQRPSATQARARLVELQKPAALAAPPPPTRRLGLAFAVLGLVIGVISVAAWWLDNDAPVPVQQGPTEPRPIAPPPPPPDRVVEPAPPPLMPELKPVPAVSASAMTWRCARIHDVSEIDTLIGDGWYLLVVTIDGEQPLLVTTPKSPKGLQQMKRVQKGVRACQGKEGTLTAKETRSDGLWGKKGRWIGLAVDAAAFNIDKPGP